MTASERIRAARETHKSLVSALDQNPVETREVNTSGTVLDTLISYRNATPEARRTWAKAQEAFHGISAVQALALIERNLALIDRYSVKV